ncbi:MAG: hypothetical protein EXR95_02340 [Gemmatimonadetes bacterium]|nr:hypothetical protein [Gemmatimonadota bacterium]
MRRILGAGLLLAAAACSTVSAPEGMDVAAQLAATSPSPVQLTLRHGQERTVDGTALRLSFLSVVEDSRCPIDAVCVWAGDGVAEIGVSAGEGPASPLRLHTNLEPKFSDWSGVRVTLIELSPASRAANPTKAADYSVRLQVEPVKR